MKNRRNFLKLSALSSIGLLASPLVSRANKTIHKKNNKVTKPIVLATWNHGVQSNEVSMRLLNGGKSALDAVEAGVALVESDPNGTSVGLGGAPDRDGHVTLDACIMNHKNQCGAVAGLENIEHPISVARKVMEETPHVILIGEGAYQFARKQGFPHRDLLTEKSKENWKKWLVKANYQPVVNSENHDTIGAIALDKNGNLSGACTTSGMAYKMRGRVGDSPIIGAGLFVDNEVGAAVATGMGEAIIRVAGSAIVVEMMRNGKSPQDACREAVERIIHKHDDMTNLQVGFLALNRDGEYGAYSVFKGFNYAVTSNEQNELIDAQYKM